VASNATFCCVQCRLLQAPTTACAECGAPMTAPLELVRELLYYRDMRFVSNRDWGLITAFLCGSSLALPILAPFAVGSMIALGVHKLRDSRRRQQIAGIPMPPATPAPGATTVIGIARKFRATVTSLVDHSPVLLEHAVVKDKRGEVLLRRTEVVPFLLEVETGPVLVTGIARVAPPSLFAQRSRVKRGDPRLVEMGIPADLGVAGDLEISSVNEGGPILAVTGMLEEEAVSDFAFHRDGGRIAVMRGRVGAPIVVEDPRLIAAAL
jgi:hypothetical protein